MGPQERQRPSLSPKASPFQCPSGNCSPEQPTEPGKGAGPSHGWTHTREAEWESRAQPCRSVSFAQAAWARSVEWSLVVAWTGWG